MLNIRLIREVQRSILDKSRPFNMGDWNCCICGHTGRVLREKHLISSFLLFSTAGFIRWTGIDPHLATMLFYSSHTRESAVLALQDLIEGHEDTGRCVLRRSDSREDLFRHQEDVLRQSDNGGHVLRGKSRSRSTRASQEQHQEAEKQEEPELAGVL